MCNWKAENFIVPTEMLKWYLNEGAKITLNWAISYVKGTPLKDFIDLMTEKRIKADRDGKPSLSLLYKTISNSCYGRLSMNLRKRSRYEHGSGSFDRSLITRNLKHINPLLIEDGELVSWEYNYHKTSYQDSVPVHCGAFILTTSKLHVLKVYFTKFFIKLTLLKTLNAMVRHLSTQHFRILYMDTGMLKIKVR